MKLITVIVVLAVAFLLVYGDTTIIQINDMFKELHY